MLGYTPIVVVVDQEKALNWGKIESAGDIYQLAFDNLVERFQMTLQNRGSAPDDYGVMYIDERDDKSFSEIRDRHYQLQENGTQFIEPTNITGVASPLKDDKSNAMALADWIVSAAGTHLLKGNSRFYERIYDHFERHPDNGDLVGTGVKIVPDTSIEKLEKHPDEV